MDVRARPARALDLVVSVIVLLVAAPVLALAALAVRLSSHGPVLHREPHLATDGRCVALLSFRVVVDGGETRAHAAVRAVVGAAERTPLTHVGRVLRATGLERLPRLLNVLAGHVSLF